MTAFEIAVCLMFALVAWWTTARHSTSSRSAEVPGMEDSVLVEAEPDLPPRPADSPTPTRKQGIVEVPAAPAPDSIEAQAPPTERERAERLETPTTPAPESTERAKTPAAAPGRAPGGRKPDAARKSAKYQRPPDRVTEW